MIKQDKNRLGEEKYNMNRDITVEFKDEYNAKIHTSYQAFSNGEVKNPYSPSVCGVGMVGVKYPVSTNKKMTKEYQIWRGIIKRCYDIKTKERNPSYKNITCCKEWLLYENFYEWLHSQSNFDKWFTGDRWAIDKDILIKGNKVYSPEACCLVPQNVNTLFVKNDAARGDLPIGVVKHDSRFLVCCINPFTNRQKYFGIYSTPIKAFQKYKKAKENYIKQVAQEEYNKGNITKKCYEAMLNYQVEITD